LQKKVVQEQKDKNGLLMPTFLSISHVLAISAYFWLNTNHLHFQSNGLSQDKSCKEIFTEKDKDNFR